MSFFHGGHHLPAAFCVTCDVCRLWSLSALELSPPARVLVFLDEPQGQSPAWHSAGAQRVTILPRHRCPFEGLSLGTTGGAGIRDHVCQPGFSRETQRREKGVRCQELGRVPPGPMGPTCRRQPEPRMTDGAEGTDIRAQQPGRGGVPRTRVGSADGMRPTNARPSGALWAAGLTRPSRRVRRSTALHW